MSETFTCGTHQAFIYKRGGRGGGRFVGELTPLASVQWERVRDDLSTAIVHVPTTECCELLGDLRVILHELHIKRSGEWVWEGPITRLEYDAEVVRIYATDVLWQSTRTVTKDGYNHAYPNIGNALDVMDFLLRQQCYSLYGDPWNVVPGLSPRFNAAGGEPKTSRVVHKWQLYVWQDFDRFAEDGGLDYTVVNRNIYYNDVNLVRFTLPPLEEQWMSQFPVIIEYGSELATRGVVTEGQGFAAVVNGREPEIDQTQYGVVDWLVTLNDDTAADITPAPPTAEELDAWAGRAEREIDPRHPAPIAVLVPENTTLMPGAPWDIADMIPGAWFNVRVDRMCRKVSSRQKLQRVVVTETPDQGEQVSITAVRAPQKSVP